MLLNASISELELASDWNDLHSTYKDGNSTIIAVPTIVSAYGNGSLGNFQQEPEVIFIIYVQMAAILVLSFLCISGNVLLLATVVRYKRLQIVGNFLIVNLSVSDLLTSSIVLPSFAITVYRQRSLDPVNVCTGIAMITLLLFSESILTLGAIALDRYLNICEPLRYPSLLTLPRLVGFLAVSWSASAIFASLPLVGLGRYSSRANGLNICGLDLLNSRVFSSVFLSCFVAPTFVTIAVCYGKIFRTARVQARKIFEQELSHAKSNVQHASTTAAKVFLDRLKQNKLRRNQIAPTLDKTAPQTGPVQCDRQPDANENRHSMENSNRPASAPELIAKEDTGRRDSRTSESLWTKTVNSIKRSVRQTRAARTVAIIIGGICACWAPYIVSQIVVISTNTAVSYASNFVVSYLAFTSSLVNPLVCFVINREFWTGFKVLVGMRRRELIKQAVAAFEAAGSSSISLASQRERFMSSDSSMCSADGEDWKIFLEKWKALQTAAMEADGKNEADGDSIKQQEF